MVSKTLKHKLYIMKKTKHIFKYSTMIAILFLTLSCGNNTNTENKEAENQEEVEGEKSEEASNFVTLNEDQIKVMNIELGTVKEVNLGTALKVNGQLELPPQNMASVSALLGGRVKWVGVIEGDFIKKGQVLARLENPEFIGLQQKYLSLKSNLSFLENDYNRKKSLEADGITSKKALQKAQADYLEGKANLNATKSTLQILEVNLSALESGNITNSINVVSPIKGYVQKISVNIGKYVSPQQEMFDIVDIDFIHLGLNVFEKDIDKVVTGQKITFALTTRSDKIYEAEIFAIGKAFEMDTRSVKVHAKIIGGHNGLLPGMFVESRIIIGNKTANALPIEAFVNEKGLDYIFVQKEKYENKIEFEKIQVNKGRTDLGFAEVVFINKLPKDAVIALKGAYYLSSEMQKSEFGDDD